ncbi:MAG: V-type ATP synthase subunit K, partial [Bullifex sp.]|nr:V-type ATP synthase subunit K [Bullifex sp.]
MSNLAYVGMVCALCFSAIGSGLGAGMAAQSAVGGWKKCYAEGKPAPFIMVAFAGAPLTQTIYGFLLMNFINSAFQATGNMLMCLGVGVFGGIAIGLSAFLQGKVA